jgi:hypothetical protein
LSYNKADKEVARAIGAHLTLTGSDVWFDEWEFKQVTPYPESSTMDSLRLTPSYSSGLRTQVDRIGFDKN